MRNILIIGATSAIAQATARRFAGRGEAFFLVGRNPEKLRSVAADLMARGAAKADWLARDLDDFEGHPSILPAALDAMGGVDVVLVAHGSLGNQARCESDPREATRELTTNFLSVASLLTPIANHFESQGKGCIAVISSVAGDRGRKDNYVYGAAKGGLTIFLQGLRNRLDRRGVHVLTIKPGFVDTPMTEHIGKNILFSSAETVASGIVRAIDGRKDVVYVPYFWKPIMSLIKAIPERYFKRTDLKRR